MTIRNLDALRHPRSVAVIGASGRLGSVGQVVLANILSGDFAGQVHAVNPHRFDLDGAEWAPSIEALPGAPDLAIVVTPAITVPDVIARLGARGTKAAVVISAGIRADNGLRQAMLDAARPHLLRIIGPNCLGVLMPHARLNASFAGTRAVPGKLALLSQSGALVTAMLDWASERSIGFSGVVSAGDMADVDLGDLIDLFAADPETGAILMYVEGVTNAPKFISAARAASRIKPVVAIKAGRSAAAGKAAFSHTGALAGSFDVYEAAFRRAGIVMVDSLTELFDAAETLCRARPATGERLGIVTNGGGAGILAVDALGETGGCLADLAPATIVVLDPLMPAAWSRGNPVGDADAERYRAALDAVEGDENVDALLVMNCPTALAGEGEIARAISARAQDGKPHKPTLACWLGGPNAEAARTAFAATDIPLFDNPEDAVRGVGHLVAARQARQFLMRTPSSHREADDDRPAARALLDQARADGRTTLNEVEAKQLLAAYGITVVPTRLAPDAEAVRAACEGLAAPYAVKIVSPEITHKSDVGGVALNLIDADAAVAAARMMAKRIASARPQTRITGFAVEAMIVRESAHELIVGIADDPTFGPVLMVGAGGKAVEVLRDKALGLPPLDDDLARAMIAKTRIARLLAGYRDQPAADVDAVARVLTALSAMAADLPDLIELDINPLLVDAKGVIALDARVRIASEPVVASKMVMRPWPAEWSADLTTRSGFALHVRPVRPDDEEALGQYFTHVTPEDLRFRFLTGLRVVDHERLAAMTQIDYRRTMTFLAFGDDRRTIIAEATLATDPDGERAEVALSIRPDLKKRGISWTLLEHALHYARAQGIKTVESVESAANDAAISLEREMGFTATVCPGDATLRIVRMRLAAVEGGGIHPSSPPIRSGREAAEAS
jgi:acetyltransferase